MASEQEIVGFVVSAPSPVFACDVVERFGQDGAAWLEAQAARRSAGPIGLVAKTPSHLGPLLVPRESGGVDSEWHRLLEHTRGADLVVAALRLRPPNT